MIEVGIHVGETKNTENKIIETEKETHTYENIQKKLVKKVFGFPIYIYIIILVLWILRKAIWRFLIILFPHLTMINNLFKN